MTRMVMTRTSTPESKLKREVLDYLDALSLTYFRMNAGKVKVRGGWMRLCSEGTADLLIFIKGMPPKWVELKAGVTAKDHAESQAAFAESMQGFGHHYRQCRSVEEVAQFLGEK
jgi:hypothetical protein